MDLKSVSQFSGATTDDSFRALNPITGEQIEPQFNSSTIEQVDEGLPARRLRTGRPSR